MLRFFLHFSNFQLRCKLVDELLTRDAKSLKTAMKFLCLDLTDPVFCRVKIATRIYRRKIKKRFAIVRIYLRFSSPKRRLWLMSLVSGQIKNRGRLILSLRNRHFLHIYISQHLTCIRVRLGSCVCAFANTCM